MKKIYLLMYAALCCSYTLSAQCNVDFVASTKQCSGFPDTVYFTYSGSTNGGGGANVYTWNFGGGTAISGTSTASENPIVSYAAGGGAGPKTVTLKVTCAGGGCFGSCFAGGGITVSQVINISLKPNVSFTSTAPQCPNVAVNFTNTAINTGQDSLTYSWDFGAGASPRTSTAANPQGIVYSSSGTKSVQFQITTASGCVNTTTQNIVISALPVANAGKDTTICANATVQIGSVNVPGNTYSWFPSSTLNNAGISNPVASPIAPTTEYIVTVTNGVTGCTATDSVKVNMLSPLIANAGSAALICQGDTVQIGVGAIQGEIYSWSPAAGLSSTTISNPLANPTTTTTYTLSVTGSGCGPVTDEVKVTVNPLPVVSFTSNAPQCVGSSVNFTNTGSTGNGYGYLWDFGADATPASSTVQNPTGIIYSTSGTKTVQLSITYNGACVQTYTNTITINALPVANAGKDTTICANTSVQIGSANIPGNVYNWFPSSTLNNAGISNPVAHPIAPLTQYVVTLTTIGTGCVNSDTVNVTMLAPLNANAGANGIICRYDTVQIGAALMEGQVYSWSPSAGLTSTVSPNPYASPNFTTTYTLTVTGSVTTTGISCPSVAAEVTVIVHQLPIVSVGKPIDTITVGASIQLVATGGLQYSWNPSYGLNNIGVNTPVANPEVTTVYTVKVIDVYGCVNEDSVKVMVIQPSVWVPNSFTPNGDGIADVFMVMGEGIKDFEFGIFNRSGEQLFYTNSMTVGWDGTKGVTGQAQPMGAYVYYIKGTATDGEVINMRGMVNLIR